ncbi:MAG TPA: beta-hexosaminidase [Clostridiaceae bacterium]|jgi:beta-N-acetylhexosaminidase|nr:beta-hexosaminidase [Clostridiaceae bacterium]
MKKTINPLLILIVFICMLLSSCTRLENNNNQYIPDPAPTTIIPGPDMGIGGVINTPLPASPVATPGITPIPTQIPDSHSNPDFGPISSLKQSQELLSKMSIEEKVGQMFIARCPQQDAAIKAAQYHIGGYILFSRDFETRSVDEVIANIKSYQDAVKIPLLIGVDEEGGNVNRISLHKQFREEPFMSPQDLYKKGGFDAVVDDTIEKAIFLKSFGINLNLAPVCDISTVATDYIFPRSFGKDAVLTSEYVKNVVTAMNNQRIGSVLKHFPGYGNNLDTHMGMAYDNRDFDTFVNNDFLPFISGINAGAGAVLVSHNIVTSMDENYPASLSPEINRVLRQDLNFNGVIMTDDLSMKAIQNYTGNSDAAVLAVLAGNDLICSTNFEEQIPAVINAVKNGVISVERLNQSVLRILLWKHELGIIN